MPDKESMRHKIKEMIECAAKGIKESRVYVKEIVMEEEYVIVKLQGAFDAETIPIIKERYTRESYRFDKHVVLDFEDVKRIDSATLAVLVNLFAELKAHDQKLIIINAMKELVSYISILRLESVITILSSEEEALIEIASG
jgi:anti-anti-sigma factor